MSSWPSDESRADAARKQTAQGSAQRVLGGRYRLTTVVGNGAMGRVWAAHDEVLNRPVAIKEVDFPPGMPQSEVDHIAERTIREARAVASVSNPHVVTIFDMLSLPHGPAIVMELLSARSLAEILAVNGPMDELAAARVGLAVATGLLAAHCAGITHRDVKPGNVLVCDDGRVKLTDFGIARSAGEQTITATGLLLGSPAYISPEVAAGRPANAQSDAWGLGALLFACVQGVPPFDRGTPMATLTAVVQDEVPPHPNSGRLGGVIRGLLVKDPATRMSVGTAQQAMVRLAADPGSLVTHAWKPTTQPATTSTAPPGAAVRPGPQASVTPAPGRSGPTAGRPQAQYGHDRSGYRPQGVLPVGPARSPQSPPMPVLPPPPWADAGAGSLRPLPVALPRRTGRQKMVLVAVAMLVAAAAAAAGYFGVRAIGHPDGSVPVGYGTVSGGATADFAAGPR